MQVIAPEAAADPTSPKQTEEEDKTTTQIAGSGGIGKSQLANYFARKMYKEKYYQWVVWLSGGQYEHMAESNIRSEMYSLGTELGLYVKSLDEAVIYQLVYERLSQKGRGLLVLDDIPNYAMVEQFLPERFNQKHIDVLMTSRNNMEYGPDIIRLTLEVFTLADAKRYVYKILGNKVTEEEAEMLAVTLDRYPLALTQALAYIDQNGCTVKEYCNHYRTVREARAVYLKETIYGTDPYEKERRQRQRKFDANISAVVSFALTEVRRQCETQEHYEQALQVLKACAYLAPEESIPRWMLRGWVVDDKADLNINKIIKALRTLSLLEEGNETFRIHQVMQDILKPENSTGKAREILISWLNAIKKKIDQLRGNAKNLDECLLLLKPHVMVLVEQLSQQQKGVYILLRHGHMHHWVAGDCEVREQENAKEVLDRELVGRQLPSVEPRVAIAICEMNLGAALLACGDPLAARDHANNAFETLRTVYTENPSLVRKSQRLLSIIEEMNKTLSELKTSDPSIAIIMAAEGGTLQQLKVLLDWLFLFANQADQNRGQRLTPLHLTVLKQRPEHAQALLECVGFNLVKDVYGSTALDEAIRLNHTAILQHFKTALVKHYARYKVDDRQLPRLVRICAKYGDESGLKLLIHLEVSIDEPEMTTGQTALHRAVKKGQVGCVKLLVAAGANVYQQDKNFETPITLAIPHPELMSIMNHNNLQADVLGSKTSNRVCNQTLLKSAPDFIVVAATIMYTSEVLSGPIASLFFVSGLLARVLPCRQIANKLPSFFSNSSQVQRQRKEHLQKAQSQERDLVNLTEDLQSTDVCLTGIVSIT